jgi:class 3 adenylate cyclase/tetratricopeptide (TPR) repeat protein
VPCTSCGTENPAGSKFCIRCGARLAAQCLSCGAAIVPGAAFCNECGAPLAARDSAGSRSTAGAGVAGAAADVAAADGRQIQIAQAPVAERRLVSVLFVDLVGFTSLSDGRDAEETRELLSRYFELSGEVVARHGGTVEKFIGDAVLAIWGAPTAREDDAERAVRAGLELVDAVKVLGSGVAARAGVMTGEAAVTLGATNEGMVAGDLVNTASRLQSVAPPGSVLVGESTMRAADRAIAFETAGEQTLKGKVSPVPAWRALRVVAERGGRNRSETLEAPFVGRETELRLLKDLFHATSREKRVRLVSVTGPAGVGKSRLAWEFLKYVDGLVERVLWHDGRSPAYGEGVSFWALGEMVRGRAKLLESDDPATTRAKIAETLALHVPDAAERRWIEPALLALLGVDPSSAASEQLFAAWRTFFERLAESAPVVLVFEDLHLADAGLLDFIDHMLEWSRNVPIFILTLARPELTERRPGWGAGKRHFTSLFLEPLSEPAMRELLLGLVPGLPDAAVRLIVARADGIPLYAVETVRMLLAEGRLVARDGSYRPVGDLTELAVPDTLTALIASRLDGLAPGERALVADAAVLGQSFSPEALAAVAGTSTAELEPRLRALVGRELLKLEADPRSPERGQYSWVQALIREVAYKTLAKRDRKSRHLAAARFFESLGSDELAGALAGHYLAAHDAAAPGPEATALAVQARIALRAAVDRAVGLGSHEQAVTFVEQALTVTDDPAARAELMLRAARSSTLALHNADAERYYTDAAGLYRDCGDLDGEALATAGLANMLLTWGRVQEALTLLQNAVEKIPVDRQGPSALAMMSALARAYRMHDEPGRALELAEGVLELAERLDLLELTAAGLLTRAGALTNRSRESLALLRAALELGVAHGFTEIEARARTVLTFVQVTNDPRAGLAEARAGLENARRLGSRLYAVSMIGNGVDCAFRTGDWDWAVETLHEWLAGDLEGNSVIELSSDLARFLACRGEDAAPLRASIEPLLAQVSDQQYGAYRSLSLAWGELAAGRLDAAREAARGAAEGSSIFPSSAYPVTARAAIWAGNPAAARSALDDLNRLASHGVAVDADRLVIRAGIAALEGHSQEAAGFYREALRRWLDAGLAWDGALCAIDMATVLDVLEPDLQPAVDTAREVLGRLGARPFLARLENAIAGADRVGPARERPAGRRNRTAVSAD